MESHLQVKNPKWMAAILMIGSFIGLFGETALNMALTNIMEDFSIRRRYSTVADYRLFISFSNFGAVISIFSTLVYNASINRWGINYFYTGCFTCSDCPKFFDFINGRLIQAIGTGISCH